MPKSLGLDYPLPLLRSLKYTTRKFLKFSSVNPTCSHHPPFIKSLTQPRYHMDAVHLASLVHSIKLELCPPHLMCFNWFSSLRTRNSLLLPKCNSSTLLRSPLFIAYSVWLTLPSEVKDLTSLRLFKIRAAPYLLRHK